MNSRLSFVLLFMISVSGVTLADEFSDVVIILPGEDNPYWNVEKKVAPQYPAEALEKGITGCLTLGYIIEPDGTTSHHKAMAGNTGFEHTARRAAEQFRYTPTEENPEGRRVFTTNTFTYDISYSRRPSRDNKPDQDLVDACSSATARLMKGELKPGAP